MPAVAARVFVCCRGVAAEGRAGVPRPPFVAPPAAAKPSAGALAAATGSDAVPVF